jgi:hypothetical protein
MTDIDLNAIRSRASSATAGPWAYRANRDIHDSAIRTEETHQPIASAVSHDDAEFIAHAREDIPALLSELARLTEVSERFADLLYSVPGKHERALSLITTHRVVVEERDALAAMMADAPHAYGCATSWTQPCPCDCWKSDTNPNAALSETPELTTPEGLDALPPGSIVMTTGEGPTTVALKPQPGEYPHAIKGFWVATGTELGTDSESLVWDGPAILLHGGLAAVIPSMPIIRMPHDT